MTAFLLALVVTSCGVEPLTPLSGEVSISTVDVDAGAGGNAGSGGSAGAGGAAGAGGGGGSAGAGGSGGGGSGGGGGGTPQVCVGEATSALCQKHGRTCGSLTATDRCGDLRIIASCGTCSGTTTCGGGGQSGTCGCTSETNATFCTRQGKACGAASGLDNCGRSRSVASCGSCVGAAVCSAGSCGCASETNAAFCARMSASCGAVSGTDACGQPRSVATCGSCYGAQTCGGGGTANKCGCASPTDAELCTSAGKDCGPVTLTDSCGIRRNVVCGTCGSPQTCGGAAKPNVCGCTPESTAAFCARNSAQCGAVTAPDNCGTPRTVAACGTCTSPKTCGANNTCACVPESDASLCQRGARACGPLTLTDNCGTARTVTSCGSCAAPSTCGGTGVTGQCGVPVAGQWSWQWPLPTGESLNAVHAVSRNDAWVVGDMGTILRWNGTKLVPYPSGTKEQFTEVFATGANDIWAVGAHGTLARFQGSGWALVTDAGFDPKTTLASVWGSSASDVWVLEQYTSSSDSLHHWDGAQWTRRSAAFITGGSLNALSGTQSDRVWAVGSTGSMYEFNGLDWVRKNVNASFDSVHALAPDSVWAAGSARYSSTSSSYPVVYRYNGTGWVGGQASGIASTDTLGSIWGTADDDLWVAARRGSTHCALHLTDGGTWKCEPSAFAITDIHGTSRTDAWFTGNSGQLSRWNGSTINLVSQSPAFAGCDGVSGVNAKAIFLR